MRVGPRWRESEGDEVVAEPREAGAMVAGALTADPRWFTPQFDGWRRSRAVG